MKARKGILCIVHRIFLTLFISTLSGCGTEFSPSYMVRANGDHAVSGDKILVSLAPGLVIQVTSECNWVLNDEYIVDLEGITCDLILQVMASAPARVKFVVDDQFVVRDPKNPGITYHTGRFISHSRVGAAPNERVFVTVHIRSSEQIDEFELLVPPLKVDGNEYQIPPITFKKTGTRHRIVPFPIINY